MEKAHSESYLSITSNDIKINLSKEFFEELQKNTYHGWIDEHVIDHIAKVLEIIDLIRVPDSYDGEDKILDEGDNWGIYPLEFLSRVNSSFDNHMKIDGRTKKCISLKKEAFRDTSPLWKSSSPEIDLFSDIKEHSEEETIEITMETMEQYMSKTRGNYGSGVVAQDQVMLSVFPMSLTGAASRWLRNEPSGLITNWETLKMKFLNKYCPPAPTTKKMEEINNFQQEPDETKRHEENSNIIKEIRASTDAAIRNQGASIKTLEIQIGQMSKVLQEIGIGGLPGSTELNPRGHVKSISTAKADSSEIHCMGCSPYAVSGSQHRSMFFETVPFPRRLQNYSCDD
ncbi:retrotransposon protein [Tanacetum coccineum]